MSTSPVASEPDGRGERRVDQIKNLDIQNAGLGTGHLNTRTLRGSTRLYAGRFLLAAATSGGCRHPDRPAFSTPGPYQAVGNGPVAVDTASDSGPIAASSGIVGPRVSVTATVTHSAFPPEFAPEETCTCHS